jgi:hypothetical protein
MLFDYLSAAIMRDVVDVVDLRNVGTRPFLRCQGNTFPAAWNVISEVARS